MDRRAFLRAASGLLIPAAALSLPLDASALTPAQRLLLTRPPQAAPAPSGASYVSSVAQSVNTSGAVSLPASLASGNTVLGAMTEAFSNTGALNSPGNSSAAYTVLEHGTVAPLSFGYFGRVINASDVSDGTVGYSGLGGAEVLGLAQYSGATAFADVSAAGASSTSITIPGFTKSVSHKGVVVLVLSYESSAAATISGNSGAFTQRLANLTNGRQVYVMDQLSGYVSGTDIVITGFSDSSQKYAVAVEMT